MKFLHSWLQDYIVEEIPKGEGLVKAIETKIFEVEEYIEIHNPINDSKDFVYDLNILPNRAHDALGHYYLACDVAAIFNFQIKDTIQELSEFKHSLEIIESENDFIRIENSKNCSRFIGAKVSGIVVKESPEIIKYRLNSIGEKSINNIVDITNYVQFSFNKPMHAYDQELVKGDIEVRLADEGEKMTTLDNKELDLKDDTLVIADKENILALAGIKGGKYSGINSETKSIIVESANFIPILIRKTSQIYNLKTEASKRFENGLADDLVEIGMLATLKLLSEFGGDEVKIDKVIDNFPNKKLVEWKYKVSVSLVEINKLLGTDLLESEVESIFKRLNFNYKYISTVELIKELIPRVLGKGYKNPSSMRIDAPEYFSCSSLVSYLYEGIYMPSISIDKYLFTRDLGSEIKTEKDLKYGDLIFRNSENGKIYYEGVEYRKGGKVIEGVDHLGMYVGDNKVIHASRHLKDGVEIESLEEFSNKGKIIGYGRVLENLEEERFVVEIPAERLDLRIKEDIIEEIGRIYGFNQIKSQLPNLKKKAEINQEVNKIKLIKNYLYSLGFNEVLTYSLQKKGEIKILKSVAKDKNYLRNNLSSGLQEAIEKNIFRLPLLGEMDETLKEFKVFEFGKCFSLNEDGSEREWLSLGIGIDDNGKNKNYELLKIEIINNLTRILEIKSGIEIVESKNSKGKNNIFEINFSELLDRSKLEIKELINLDVKNDYIYKEIIKTPFIVRDIALWPNQDTKESEVLEIISSKISPLVVKLTLFDEFEKEIDGIVKKSFAYRLVYQDKERTLTDEEVNQEADLIYKALKERGFEIR